MLIFILPTTYFSSFQQSFSTLKIVPPSTSLNWPLIFFFFIRLGVLAALNLRLSRQNVIENVFCLRELSRWPLGAFSSWAAHYTEYLLCITNKQDHIPRPCEIKLHFPSACQLFEEMLCRTDKADVVFMETHHDRIAFCHNGDVWTSEDLDPKCGRTAKNVDSFLKYPDVSCRQNWAFRDCLFVGWKQDKKEYVAFLNPIQTPFSVRNMPHLQTFLSLLSGGLLLTASRPNLFWK